MKILVKIGLFLCVTSVLISCEMNKPEKETEKTEKEPVQFKAIAVRDLYKIDIPNYMKSTDKLNDDADLQYMSEDEASFIIIIDESKEEFVEAFRLLSDYDDDLSPLENYANVQMENFYSSATFEKDEDFVAMNINGMKALRKEAHFTNEDVEVPMSMQFVFYEGKESLYYMMTWTARIREDLFIEDQMKMIKSMEEL